MLPFDTGAVALARAIRSRSTSSEEAVRLSVSRIASHDPELGAFVQTFGESAIQVAKKKDARMTDAPFHGVPIAIKDLNFVRFRTTRFGSKALPAIWSPVDDVTVSRLRAAGFVFVGKTATSELGVVPITEPVGNSPSTSPSRATRASRASSRGGMAAMTNRGSWAVGKSL